MTDARKIEVGEPGRIERSLEPRRAPRFDRGIPPQIIDIARSAVDLRTPKTVTETRAMLHDDEKGEGSDGRLSCSTGGAGLRIAPGSLGALLTLAPLHWILPLLKAGVPLAAMSNPVTVALIGLLILGILFATGGKKRRRK